ncbi:MAG: flagellar motor protein MotB [Acidobacteriota bacterium]
MRKKKAAEHMNHERWMVSYADFVTLLFAFFTTMYAISTVDAQKMGRMVLSMRASFDGAVFSPGTDTLSLSKGEGAGSALSRDLVENIQTPKDKAIKEYSVENLKELKTNFVPNALPQGEVLAMTKLRQDVETMVKQKGISNKVHTRKDTRGLVISLDGSFFDSGSDQLRPEGYDVLKNIAPELLQMPNLVCIEGHTDNVPINTPRFHTNWELSCARATAVVCYLIQQFSFTPEKLSTAGYGEYHPIDTNDTAAGRAHNRRIDIVILNSGVSRAEPR